MPFPRCAPYSWPLWSMAQIILHKLEITKNRTPGMLAVSITHCPYFWHCDFCDTTRSKESTAHTPNTAHANGRAWGVFSGMTLRCLMGRRCKGTVNTRLASWRSRLQYWSSAMHVIMMKQSLTLFRLSSVFVSCITMELGGEGWLRNIINITCW